MADTAAGPASRGQLIYGDGGIEQVPEYVAASGANRVLLVCGKASFEASGALTILPRLEQVARVVRWSEFSPNPDIADVQQGLDVLRHAEPDLVVGVGGGSAMDMAKLLCAFEDVADGSPDAGIHEVLRSGRGVRSRRPGLVLVPTTSGTGSEATHFAVVYLGQEKYSVAGPVLLPDLAVLDPSLTLSGSPYQRATSGIDAVAQAVESLWATDATAASRRFARKGLDLLLHHLEDFVRRPSGLAAHGMAVGSHLAGRAIDISKTTAAHALSYGITKSYGVSHGHAVALTLGPFIETHADMPPQRLQATVDRGDHEAAMSHILQAFGASKGPDARQRFVELLGRIGLSPHLADVGLTEPRQRVELAQTVNLERLGNNPAMFDQDDLVEILERAT